MQWYDDVADRNPNWYVIKKYIDEGITGTQAKKRPAFLRMIQDAKQKKFDLIVTREDILNNVSSLYQIGVFQEYQKAAEIKATVGKEIAKLDEKLKRLTRMRLEDEIPKESYLELKKETPGQCFDQCGFSGTDRSGDSDFYI